MNTASARRAPNERTTGPHGKEGEGEKKVKVKVKSAAASSLNVAVGNAREFANADDASNSNPTKCCYPPCSEPAAKGRGKFFCTQHEYRWRKGGASLKRPPRTASPEAAFRNIGYTVTADGCWEWNGAKVRGYGRFRGENATRVMWRLVTGEVLPDDLHMCHRCDNPPCINPEHLFPGTRSDNMRDMYAKGRHPGTTHLGDMQRRLTDQQVQEIRDGYTGKWGDKTRLARQYGVSPEHVRRILDGSRR